jgi:hypothetical protein
MKQQTFATVKGFEKHSRKTRKEAFLSKMEVLVPWSEFCALIEPYYPKAGKGAAGGSGADVAYVLSGELVQSGGRSLRGGAVRHARVPGVLPDRPGA